MTRAPTHRQLHYLLSVANFAQGLGAFSVIGIVATVGHGMSVPLHEAGLLVSLYAIVRSAGLTARGAGLAGREPAGPAH